MGIEIIHVRRQQQQNIETKSSQTSIHSNPDVKQKKKKKQKKTGDNF